MFSVSADLYEILSLAMRYVFVFLGILIVLRTFRWMASDRRETKARLRRLPDSGRIGELVVLQGSSELPAGLCLQVPWEGVLGSVRTCDLVVPVPGVHRNHLDFSWQNGAGLLLRPRHGCSAQINGQPSSGSSLVLRHGDCLLIGGAVLQLHLFTGLQGTVPDPAVPAASSFQREGFPEPSFSTDTVPDPSFMQPFPVDPGSVPVNDSFSPIPFAVQPEADEAQQSAAPAEPAAEPRPSRTRHSDRWKEDWSE